MDMKCCKSCAHYYQHYTLDKRKILRVHCGHCVLDKVKNKKPNTAACQSYVPAPPDEEAFASKEYLSKELLQYMLNLELLPAIEDAV